MKCNCRYCYFQSVGIAKEAVEFVDQTEAKKKALDFVYSAFREAHPGRRAGGLSENTVAIMLAEWGLGKTQLLKYLRTAINNSAGVSTQLRDEYDVPFREDSPLAQLTLETFVDDILREEPEFEPRVQDWLGLLTEHRGVAFRIDALKFHDEAAGESNLLVPLFNIVLRRSQIDHRVTNEDLRSVTQVILDHFGADRLFIFFDELEALRTMETGPLQFDRFFQNFAIRIKSLIDDSSPPDVSICLATIPSVWERLTRQFEELGALRSRASTAFIELAPLTLEKAHRFVLSRCQTAANSPFTDGTIRTLLEATSRNPRYLNQLCFGLQPVLKAAPAVQYALVLDHLSSIATDRTAFTYDHQALLEMKDAATENLPPSKLAIDLLSVLTGELREYSPAELRPHLEEKSVPRIEEELNRLCSTRLRGVYPIVKLISLDRSKTLMQSKSLREQRSLLTGQHYLSESDVRIEKQRLLVHDLDYERQIINPLESRFLDGSPVVFYLPVDDAGGVEEMMALWQLNEGPAREIYRTLYSVAAVPQSAHRYRLSMAARERIFPRQSPKEPPFEWVDETFWREAFADLHDPAKSRSDKRHLLLNGLRLAGQAYGAQCTAVDETAFLWVLEEPHLKNVRYTDSKPLRSLVQLVNDTTDLETPEFRNRLLGNNPDFLICMSLVHLPDRPKVIPNPEGRPQLEVIYHELGIREEFDLQLLSKLNQEATSRGWYHSGKMKAAQESIADDVYGKVIEDWLECAEEAGCLVIGWKMPHSVREDSLARVIREVISTVPVQPATSEDMMGHLRRLGLRDQLDAELFSVLERNEQLVRDDEDRLRIQLLPIQKYIVQLSGRFPRNHGEIGKDYVRRIAACFWHGPDTELDRELERHILVVEELGYFDSHTDLDLTLQRIADKLDKVKHRDRDGASIDQYSYIERLGQTGAKRAERLSRERDYFREQYRLHSGDFQRIEYDRDYLIPRVIRHQLIDVEKRAQEIIATGEGAYEEGRKAVNRGRELLRSTHYELVEGAEIKIKDHVEALQDYTNHPLLAEIVKAHQDGIVTDDDTKNLRSAPSLTQQLEEELRQLVVERDEVRREIEIYGERHYALMAQATQLSTQPGLQQRAKVQINQLKRAEPAKMFQYFKAELEGAGLAAGKKIIANALSDLDKSKIELDSISELAQDLQRLSNIIDLLRAREQILSTFLEPSSQVTLWGETYELAFVTKQASEILKKVQGAREKLEGLQNEYRATKTEREILDEEENLNIELGKEIEGLRESQETALRTVEGTISVEESSFEAAMIKPKEMSGWASQTATIAETAFRAELHSSIVRVFTSLSSQAFHEKVSALATTVLKQGFQVAQGITELADWLATEHLKLEDFDGTDLEQDARALLDERDKIEKLCTSITRLKKWETLYGKLDSLLGISGEDSEASGLVLDFNKKIVEIRTRASEAANESTNSVESFIEALLAANLLSVPQRGELVDSLDELRKPDYSYREVIVALEHLNRRASEDAKSQLQAKELPGGHDPEVVLAIVQKIYQKPDLSLREALKLDQETEGNTILWLVRQGVLEGKLRLSGE